MQINMVIMKIALAVLLLALALSSSAHAFLRPRFPHRTYPPVGGTNSAHLIVDDSIRTARSTSAVHRVFAR
jgi:hypothetical protein